MGMEALGAVEVMFFADAVVALDTMLNAAYVELLDCKKYLGGRMVTLVVGGTVSNVTAAIDCVREAFRDNPALRNTVVIPKPHEEILKFIKH